MFKRATTGSSKQAAPARQAEALLPAAKQAAGAARQAAGELAAGKQAYEARRAAKAGVSLDRWLSDKQKRAAMELEAARVARRKAAPTKPGLLKRLLDRAHRPF